MLPEVNQRPLILKYLLNFYSFMEQKTFLIIKEEITLFKLIFLVVLLILIDL